MHRNNAGELLMNAWNEEPWVAQVEAVAGRTLRQVTPLHGGMIGEVYRVQFADGAQAVAKVDRRPQPELAVEGMMLAYLGAHSDVPVPGLWYVAPDLLLMDYLPGASRFDMGQRIREVEQGPDGAIYLLEDGQGGRMLRLTPAK